MSRRIVIAAVVVVAGLVAAIVAFAVSRSTSGSRTASPPIPTLPPPGDFVDRIDHPFFPLGPGTTFTYTGQSDGAPRKVTVLVTHKTKLILGISATVVLDQVLADGKPEEKTWDWYAQDSDGNVWYLGEDSFDYVDGKWVRSDGSWQAGVDGAKAGIIMEARPHVGDMYRQESYPRHAEDMAKVIDTNGTVTVPFGSFDHALVTSEWTPLEKGVVEHKYYARGVGNVRTVMVKGGSEEELVVSVTH
jgi:hypothetical protein